MRRGHLECMFNLLKDHSRGYYVGGMKPDELRNLKKKTFYWLHFLWQLKEWIYLN